MQLDYVDIFYHHRMDPETPLEETILALDQIVRSGKALYAGISNYDGEHAKKALEIAKEIHLPLIINQNRYNIFDRTVEKNGLKDYARESGMGLICFSPLAQGMLSEKYINGIPADSRVARDGRFLHASDITPEKIEKIKKLDALAKERVCEIKEEKAVQMPYLDFQKTAAFLVKKMWKLWMALYFWEKPGNQGNLQMRLIYL